MTDTTACIGFGEAGTAFARPRMRAYDRKTDDAASRAAKRADYAAAGVTGHDTAAGALEGAGAVLSLVTADQSLAAARACAPLIAPGALWLDMNSVAPATKCAARDAIAAVGGRHVDVAIMAPVNPQRMDVPLLLSGEHAEAGAEWLYALGFTNVRVVGAETGAASSIKMIRSVMVKGIEALAAECLIAAEAAGVTREVLASLDASESDAGWEARADYALGRMMVHGLRRAAEMEEVAKTLAGLGTDATMTRGTIERQRAIGALGLTQPPAGLAAKLAAVRAPRRDRAA